MTCRPAKTVHACIVLAVTAILVCDASRAEAQIAGIPPALADPRPDPLLLMPIISDHTQLRVAGIVHTKRPIVDAADYAVGLIGETPTVRGRLTLFPPEGSAISFAVAFQSVPNTLAPHRTGFTGTIKTFELIGDVPTNTGAILTLDCTNCPRGSALSAGVYVEEIPLAQGPSFAPYFVGVLDPKTDGIIDPKSDSVIDPKGDSVIDPKVDGVLLMPVVTAFTQLHVTGVVHAKRPFRDPDTLGLIGDTPTIRGRLMLFFPDGTSSFFDIDPFVIMKEKDMPHRRGFIGVVSLNLIGDVPANTSASLAFDCVGCPRGALMNAGVYVEETSAVPNPSFTPYFVGVIDPKVDPVLDPKTDSAAGRQ